MNGIQTQIEGDQGKGDDTALNNVNLNCREISISCTHEIVNVFDYANSGMFMNGRSNLAKLIQVLHRFLDLTQNE